MATVYDSWAVGGSSLNAQYKFAQTFVASDNYTLTRVDLALGSIDTPANTFTVTITLHAVDGSHEPTGASLADMGSIASAGMGGLALRTFEDDSCNITSGVEYAIVGTITGDAGSLVRIDGKVGYANGIGWTQYIEGTWAAAGRDWYFRAIGTPPVPEKAITPAPEHEEADVDTELAIITWEDGGGADTFDVFIGVQGDALTEVSSAQSELSWRSPYVCLNIRDYNPGVATGYRSPIAGDVIYDGTDSYTITNIVVGQLLNVQYQAKLFAFRTEGPGDKSGGDVLTNGVAPDVEDPQAVSVTLNDSIMFTGEAEEPYLPQGIIYEWRIDSTNDNGTTTGDTWTFTSFTFEPPLPPGATVDEVGVQGGTPTGENAMIQVKRLVVAANNKIWYEDV